MKKKINGRSFNSKAKVHNGNEFDEKRLTVESKTTEILHEKSKQQKSFAQKIHCQMSQSKNIQDEKAYGNGSDIKILLERLTLRSSTVII